ncbi:MAG: hypothetical protein HY547_05965 [Elusimicrobia bacterium]|nr:hypothetical protein [Elusimicrobiota bacterium]
MRSLCSVARCFLALLFWTPPMIHAQEEVFPPPPPDENASKEAADDQNDSGNDSGGASVITGPVGSELKPDRRASEAKPEAPAVKSSLSAKESGRKKSVKLSPELAKITIRLSDVPLAVFLKAISQQTRVNFIVSEGLEQKKVTAFLEGVTLEEALNVLLGIKGLAYEKIPGKTHTYLITTRKETQPRTVTRIFELDYIPLQDIDIEELSGEDESSSSLDIESGSSSSGSSEGSTSSSEEAGSGIVKIIQTVLSQYGRIAVDERTNSLIVTDLPERFAQIEGLIRDLDKKSPQVSIETQIVEINSDGLNKLGIEFGGADGELFRFVGPSRYSDFVFKHNSLSDIDVTASDGASLSGLDSAYTSPTGVSIGPIDEQRGISLGVVSFNDFQVLLRAIVTKTRGKILARPRISTVNNKPAEIRVTTNQAIGSASTSSGQTTSSSVERQQTGLILRVTPQVNGDGYITMIVEPKMTRVQDSLISTSVKDPVTRAVKTMVRVRNGETVVLGGLMNTSEEKTIRKVPLLGDIPIIGWILFRSRETETINSELAVFLTPTILEK